MASIDPFDIVITTNSGYPLDQNLYQTVKGMSAAACIVREGGAIISASECSDGVPSHGNYGQLIQMRDTAKDLLEMINDPSFRVFDQWVVQSQANIQTKAECYLYSSLDDETVRKGKYIPIRDVETKLVESRRREFVAIFVISQRTRHAPDPQQHAFADFR